MPQISVIIPIYNSEKYLKECIDSVVKQTFKDIEIICIDDGSTDASRKIIEEYKIKDDRIKILYQQNSFAGVARNNGIANAQGEYIMFLDSDDIYVENAIEVLYSKITESKADVVKACFAFFDAKTGELFSSKYSQQKGIPVQYHNKIISFNNDTMKYRPGADVPWNGIYRREFLLEHNIRFNNLSSVNDHSFFIHCWISGAKFLVIDDVVAQYRYNNQESLIGKKYKNYNNQISNYKIVKELCVNCEIDIDMQKAVMQQELNTLFNWYLKLRKTAEEAEGSAKTIDDEMIEFLLSFDNTDVGKDFFEKYRYKPLYDFLTNLHYSRESGISIFIECQKKVEHISKKNLNLVKKLTVLRKAEPTA